MVQINGVDVVDRHNRPSVMQRVLLRTFFVNDGQLVDPYSISSVTIHALTSNTQSSSLLDETGLLASSVVPLMSFGLVGQDLTHVSSYSFFNYDPDDPLGNGSDGISCSSVSGIYRLGVGQYGVVLDGTINLSGVYNSGVVANSASAAVHYLDVWTLKRASGSTWQTIINRFTLFDDTFISFTEPLLLTPKNSLLNRDVVLGQASYLKIRTEILVGNRNITEDIRNIFKHSAVTSAAFEIVKVNEGLPEYPNYTVSGYSDTSALIDITADDTMVFLWDTSKLHSIASQSNGSFGNVKGVYYVRARYKILDQTFITDRMNFIVK